nr:junctional sarcoplasmic reticulum protein 1 isoform X2 [Doryrhamphus excisus]
MYTNRKVKEETSGFPQQPKVEPKTLPRETSVPRKLPLHKSMSIQNLAQIETPWENVTLNRCLFVAITILVLTSGMQRLHEALRGQEVTAEEEEVELTVRHPSLLQHRGKPLQPETTLWEVLFWWLPDLDDDNGKRHMRKGGVRNKPVPDKKLMKQRDGTLKSRRAKKVKGQEAKVKKEKDAYQKHEENEEVVPNTKTQEKKKTQKG